MIWPLMDRTAAALALVATAAFAASTASLARQPDDAIVLPVETTGDNAAARAKDAFGERVGQEQVGLYNESQVRGFNLATTASYRLEGRYFLREYSLPDVILDGVSVKVGVNVARQNYPSPSGVVDYRLRKTQPGLRTLSVHTGIKENMSVFAEATGSYGTDDGRFGIAGGATVTPRSRFSNLTGGYLLNAGAVPQWQPNDSVRIRAILSGEYSTYDGDYVYVRTGQALPPKPPREKFAVPWAEVKRRSINTGLLIDADPAPDWTLTATAFYADTKRSPVDFTSAALTNARTAQITWIHTDVLHGRTATGELATERRFTTGTADHALIAAVRGRHSRQLNISRAPVFVGTVDVDDPVFPLQPALPPALGELHSDVDQGIFSLGYRGDYFGRLEFKVGLHRSVYTKKVSPPGGAKTSRTTRKWLYDASLVLAATGKTTLFANAVRPVPSALPVSGSKMMFE
ncbi:MAG: TonB-dependent receptor [Rhodobacteraceae bacterium]|nr:TonB-dependent receptor [Paracoccaceae bacterium]